MGAHGELAVGFDRKDKIEFELDNRSALKVLVEEARRGVPSMEVPQLSDVSGQTPSMKCRPLLPPKHSQLFSLPVYKRFQEPIQFMQINTKLEE